MNKELITEKVLKVKMTKIKSKKVNKTDSESGWFHKSDHKSVFAHNIQTDCDKNGFVTSFSLHKGNEHDIRTFKALYNKIKEKTYSNGLEKNSSIFRLKNTRHYKIINRW